MTHAAPATTTAAQVSLPDGRVELADPDVIAGLIPALKPLYDYSWVVGFGAGLVGYLVLSLAVPSKRGGVRG
jgi:cytosine/uracil/thiamine/allantoin permease